MVTSEIIADYADRPKAANGYGNVFGKHFMSPRRIDDEAAREALRMALSEKLTKTAADRNSPAKDQSRGAVVGDGSPHQHAPGEKTGSLPETNN